MKFVFVWAVGLTIGLLGGVILGVRATETLHHENDICYPNTQGGQVCCREYPQVP